MATQRASSSGRRVLWLIVAIGLAPVVASYAAYYWFTPSKRVNYGELLETAPAPALNGSAPDGRPFALADLRGKWVLLVAARVACTEACGRALYATRQARTIQGREEGRIVRLLLQPSAAPALSADVSAAHPDLVEARIDRHALEQLPLGASPAAVVLLDPRGNLVLRYDDPDIRGLANDLQRVLKASQIG